MLEHSNKHLPEISIKKSTSYSTDIEMAQKVQRGRLFV